MTLVTDVSRDLCRKVLGGFTLECLQLKGTSIGGICAVNAKNPTVNLSLAELRKILAGEKRSWPGGQRIKLIVRQPGCHEREVLLKLLGMSESEYKQYWIAQVFHGDADSEPVAVPSFGMMLEAILLYPGAIGLVKAQEIRPGMTVRTIKVDGRMPGEAGYPLH